MAQFADALRKKGVKNVYQINIYDVDNNMDDLEEAIFECMGAGIYTNYVSEIIRGNLAKYPLEPGEQLNLVGYSGGGITAYNVASNLARFISYETTMREAELYYKKLNLNYTQAGKDFEKGLDKILDNGKPIMVEGEKIKHEISYKVDNLVLIGKPGFQNDNKNVKHTYYIRGSKDKLTTSDTETQLKIKGFKFDNTTIANMNGVKHSKKDGYFNSSKDKNGKFVADVNGKNFNFLVNFIASVIR